MKKIIILIAMLCAFASANCRIYNGEKFVSVFCENGSVNFSIYMRKDGKLIEYIDEFNNKTIKTVIYDDKITRLFCKKTTKDEYGFVIDEKILTGCKTPVETWNDLRTVYHF